MTRFGLLVGLALLAGCREAPASHEQPKEDAPVEKPQDPNLPDSFGIVKICGDGTKIYLLSGGEASGQYAIWTDKWELLSAGVTPESVCSKE